MSKPSLTHTQIKKLRAINNKPNTTKLVASILSITNPVAQDKYVLSFDTIYSSNYREHLTSTEINLLKYNQYSKSIQALLHNIKFIWIAQSLGLADEKGNVKDMKWLLDMKFQYPSDLRSISSHSTIKNNLQTENSLHSDLSRVLSSSITIIEDLESDLNIDSLKQSVENFDQEYAKRQNAKNSLISKANLFIEKLNANKINLDVFKQNVSLRGKSQSIKTNAEPSVESNTNTNNIV